MRDLNYEINKLCERNKDGSKSTQANRKEILNQIANQIHALGFRNLKLGNIKPKHIEALVNHWLLEGLAPGTLKNRMSCLRWVAEKLNKPSLIAKDNSHYGIDRRTYVTNISKACDLDLEKLEKITDSYVKLSLKLQELFGLRREESIKFIAEWSDRGDHIVLKASWCKGGRSREIPIRNEQQRNLLNEVKSFSKGKSLIPINLSYVQQMNRYKDQTAKACLCKMHGLRHAFAQLRYLELTGRLAPAAGGKTSKELTAEEKVLDKQARLIISRELGHEREQITAVYLGR
ncbi:MAG TPA: phage integrase N-terminal domain-containing protein [Methylotenera sp.]